MLKRGRVNYLKRRDPPGKPNEIINDNNRSPPRAPVDYDIITRQYYKKTIKRD